MAKIFGAKQPNSLNSGPYQVLPDRNVLALIISNIWYALPFYRRRVIKLMMVVSGNKNRSTVLP